MCSFQPPVEEEKLSIDLFIFSLPAMLQTIMVLKTRKLFGKSETLLSL